MQFNKKGGRPRIRSPPQEGLMMGICQGQKWVLTGTQREGPTGNHEDLKVQCDGFRRIYCIINNHVLLSV